MYLKKFVNNIQRKLFSTSNSINQKIFSTFNTTNKYNYLILNTINNETIFNDYWNNNNNLNIDEYNIIFVNKKNYKKK